MKRILIIVLVLLLATGYSSAETEGTKDGLVEQKATDQTDGVDEGEDLANQDMPEQVNQGVGVQPTKDANSCITSLDSINLADLSVEDLLTLKELIDVEINNRGVVTYFDIRRGDKGEDVARLQERLRDLGYYSGQISGKYDTETQKSMKQFEKTNGLDNDGDASREDQVVLFSDAAVPKETIKQGEETSRLTSSKKEEEEEYPDYGEFDYTEVFRYPERHIGEKVKLIGKVVQVLGDRKSGFQLRFDTGNGDIVFVTINHDPEYNILENDRMRIYGVVTGTITYESIWNQTITIPAVNADVVILR